jgi:hypothetical protein
MIVVLHSGSERQRLPRRLRSSVTSRYQVLGLYDDILTEERVASALSDEGSEARGA